MSLPPSSQPGREAGPVAAPRLCRKVLAGEVEVGEEGSSNGQVLLCKYIRTNNHLFSSDNGKKSRLGTAEMALGENPSSVSSTHIRWLTTARGSDALFWPSLSTCIT